jgi:hypothetical protein
MPTLVAAVTGSLAGAAVRACVRPYCGVRLSAAIALVTMLVVFWGMRRWLTHLRDGT